MLNDVNSEFYDSVSLPSAPLLRSDRFEPVSNGSVFIGFVDSDPRDPDNQIPVYAKREDGALVQVNQPLKINASGYLVYNGKPHDFVVFQGYSLLVLDSADVQQHYYADLTDKNGASFLRTELLENGLESLVYVSNFFEDLKLITGVKSKMLRTQGHHIKGIGAALYIQDDTTGLASSGNEYKFFDADGKGWVLDPSQRVTGFMFGLVGYGDNTTDETSAMLKALSYSSASGNKLHIDKGIYGYYLMGEVVVPNNTYVDFSSLAEIKAKDTLRQVFENNISFEVLFRFSDTKGATWLCNGAKMYYDKTKYKGEHNHVFMFDGASDLYIHDPHAIDAGGDGYYVGGRFSVSKHCSNVHLFRPFSSQARRNNMSVISVDGLFVHDHDFRSAGRNGNNPSGPCAGIDVEPETYTDALRARFYGGRTYDNLRQGTVFAMTKLPAGVVVDIEMIESRSYSDSRGFECTRVNARNEGLIRLINPVAEKSRFSSFHSINSAANGILFEVLHPLAIDPSTSAEDQNGGNAPYYINNYNDGSSEDIYPKKCGGVRIIEPAIKFINSYDRPEYCLRVKLNSATINNVNDIQVDNIEIINPLFKKTDYNTDCYNFTSPSGITYNPILDVKLNIKDEYRKDNPGNGFNARSYPGGYFSNLGSTQNMTINLNTAIVGRSYKFIVLASTQLIVQPGGVNILPNIPANTGNQRMLSNVIGSTLHIACEDVGGMPTWVVKSLTGTWTVS